MKFNAWKFNTQFTAKGQVLSNTAAKVDRTASMVVTHIATVMVVRVFTRASRLFMAASKPSSLFLISSTIPYSLATRSSTAIFRPLPCDECKRGFNKSLSLIREG